MSLELVSVAEKIGIKYEQKKTVGIMPQQKVYLELLKRNEYQNLATILFKQQD